MCFARGSDEAMALGWTLHGGLSAEDVMLARDDQEQADTRHDAVEGLATRTIPSVSVRDTHGEMAEDEAHTQHCQIHTLPLQGAVFSTVLLPRRLPVLCDSDNVPNIAYYQL